MSIPDYQALMLPLLRLASDGAEHAMRDVVEALAEELGLTEEERRELLPSGQQARFANRVHWARSYLKQAGLLDSPRRGYMTISARGREVLAEAPAEINVEYLMRFPEFREFRSRSGTQGGGGDGGSHGGGGTPSGADETPEESVESAYQAIRADLAKELLEQVKASSPAFFEQLVVDLLVKMGYGGTRSDAGQAIGKSGDGGIDGIIKEDRLGLDIVYIQAKRWEGTVGRPEIQKFAGALQGQRAKKGVFITTSGFTKDAEEYAGRLDSKIILIDGTRLADFMIDFGVGVTPFAVYELKRIDADYFVE